VAALDVAWTEATPRAFPRRQGSKHWELSLQGRCGFSSTYPEMADQPEKQTRTVFFDASDKKLVLEICHFLLMGLFKTSTSQIERAIYYYYFRFKITEVLGFS
jgi:hypothetical protein